MSETWTWLVGHGRFRESVLVESASMATVDRFKSEHPSHENIRRPAGYHWDGGKLGPHQARHHERGIQRNSSA